MPCENYREALIEAAASIAVPSREVRSHLDACASCRAAFTEETQLFAAIDTSLHASANSEMPASLFPRVRAGLNEKPVPQRSWIPAGAALAAVAALVVAIVFVRTFGRGAGERNPQMSSAAHNESPALVQPSTQTAGPSETSSSPAKIRSGLPFKAGSIARIEQVAVLIPAGQKQAINALLANVQQGKLQATVVLAGQSEKNRQDLQIVPLDISPIEMKPLADVGVESPALQNDKIKR